ncbi:MAG: hypothetical protein LBT27_10190 [Prevotellaceae bacterium]|jgi:hypothetical protein|nr:hypothetical protein [Prevotellaceae bacterium]
MKRFFILIVINLLFINSFAQADNKIVVVDSITHNAIEYASIIFTNVIGGTYSNNKGFILIPQNVEQIELSGIGYYSKKVALNKNIDTIFLLPQVYEISEAKVMPAKKRKSVELGYIKQNSTYHMIYKSGDEVAVHIPLTDSEDTYKLIKYIIMKSGTNIKYTTNINQRTLNIEDINNYLSIFKINFYRATENKEIGELINTEDIVFTSDVLRNKTKLDVNKYNIYMPDNGIFVAVEFVGKLNPKTDELIINIKEHIIPSIHVSWKIKNSIVYEKRKFLNSANNWQRVDKNNEFVKNIKLLNKELEADSFYTPLISIVLE